MSFQITIADYSSDWAIKDWWQDPRSKPGYLTKEEVIRFYGTLGLEAVELNHGYWRDMDAARVKQLVADAGLRIINYGAHADLALPPDQRRSELEAVYAILERTAQLGAKGLFLIPGRRHPEFSLEHQRSWLIDGLRAAAARAHSLGVTIICENIDWPPMRPFMGRGSQCREVCAEVDSPGLRLIYDMAAPIFVGEDSLQAFSDMSAYVAHAHIKNFRRLAPGENPDRSLAADDETRYTGTTLDRGVLSVENVVRELKNRGYNGFLQLEYQGEDDPRTALPHNVEYLRTILRQVNTAGTQTA
jgi:sugar phosphate isomerase/epimerase